MGSSTVWCILLRDDVFSGMTMLMVVTTGMYVRKDILTPSTLPLHWWKTSYVTWRTYGKNRYESSQYQNRRQGFAYCPRRNTRNDGAHRCWTSCPESPGRQLHELRSDAKDPYP